MKKFFCFILSILLISCDYKKPEKDKHPEIPTFSEVVLLSPEKFSLKPISADNEDVKGVFIVEGRLILVSDIREGSSSGDSIVISDFKSLDNVQKHYFQKGVSDDSKPKIEVYKTDFIDNTIYTTYHKFSAPDYKPVLLDSTFADKREAMHFEVNFADYYKNDHVLEPYEDIVVGNTSNCGGGKLGGPIVCPVYLNYYKIDLPKKSISFKELEGFNQFKVLTAFGKKLLFYHSDFRGNSRLFLID